MSGGYYKRRRGIVEHIESGAIDLLESGIHDYLLLKANLVIGSKFPLPPGVCMTSAPAIHAYCRRVSERTIQRCLNHLEALDFIKTWRIPGKRGNFPVLVCRASVHDLSGMEYRINGAETKDWRYPVIEPVGELSGTCRGAVQGLAGYREVDKERREKKPAAKPAPPADPRYQPFVDFAFKTFHVQHGQKPTWGMKDFSNLKALLKRTTNLNPEELTRRWTDYLASTEAFTVKQGGSLAYFCTHFDSFMAGPIFKRKEGKPDASTIEARNLAAAGFRPIN